MPHVLTMSGAAFQLPLIVRFSPSMTLSFSAIGTLLFWGQLGRP